LPDSLKKMKMHGSKRAAQYRQRSCRELSHPSRTFN
jgi:hypothetical protein